MIPLLNFILFYFLLNLGLFHTCFQTELDEELIIKFLRIRDLYHIEGRNNIIRVLNVIINTSKKRKRLRVLSLLLLNKGFYDGESTGVNAGISRSIKYS